MESPYDSLILGLNFENRQTLYNRIDLRVDEMMKNGLLEEAEELWRQGSMKTAANAIGFKEFIPFFENRMPLEACIDKIKQETRRYAKRQLTWFRKNQRIQWIILGEFDKRMKF